MYHTNVLRLVYHMYITKNDKRQRGLFGCDASYDPLDVTLVLIYIWVYYLPWSFVFYLI